MTVVTLMKVRGGLVPCDPGSERFLERIPFGEGVQFSVKVVRRVRQHRKFFALLRLAFDTWEPPRLLLPVRLKDGQTIEPQRISRDFEKFREELLVKAGHYDAHYGVDGSVVLTARSISFEALGDEEFADLYQRMVGVVWDLILRSANYRSPQEVEMTVNRFIAAGY